MLVYKYGVFYVVIGITTRFYYVFDITIDRYVSLEHSLNDDLNDVYANSIYTILLNHKISTHNFNYFNYKSTTVFNKNLFDYIFI